MGGGNEASLGIADAPVRQDAVLMMTRELLDVNVCELVERPVVRTAWGPITSCGFILCLFSPSLFFVSWKQPKLRTKSFSYKSTFTGTKRAEPISIRRSLK